MLYIDWPCFWKISTQDNTDVYFLKFLIWIQEKLNRALMVCQDKFDSAKLQQNKNNMLNDLESCVEHSIQDSIKTLPHLAEKLKASFSVNN